MNIPRPKLPIALLEHIDDVCAEFEKSWQSENPSSIEAILESSDVAEHRNVLLGELVALDVDYRHRRGQKPTRQEYTDRFPEHVELIAEIFADDDKPSGPFATPSVANIARLFPALDVIELLGAGGMGAVYKAKQKGLDRVVALKILPSELGQDAKFSLRFTREARTLAKLNHPNIVSVYEFGHVEDTYFFVMEFVDGPTLREVVRGGELDPKQALAIVPHLCDALQYAHDNGVIHRDIKPENILLTKTGEVKIVDFGLSRLLGGPEQASGRLTGLTGTHQVMGTPRYMAPEQFEGTHNVDHRADIYSLGVVFYELLTGELPMGRFAVPSKKVSIDVRLDEVVLRTLEKEPSQRYQAASEVKSDIQSIAMSNDEALAVTLAADIVSSNPTSPARTSPARTSPARTSPARTSPSANRLSANQESAARMLLTRRELFGNVRDCLRPLFRLQILQLFLGIFFVALGAYGWARNTDVPHRLAAGLIVHIYGVALIAAAIVIMVRIKDVDVSASLDEVRSQVACVRRWYLRLIPVLIGFVWWWIWIPIAIAAGFDQIMHPHSLYPSLIVGMVGFAVSIWLFVRVQRPSRQNSEFWKSKLAGTSLQKTARQLDELEQLDVG